ncbi:MAG TPA: phosphatidate cytidylyltransferase [Desulfotomaculum sp.]|nr:phosphatidate cytidylyltransferase [Desulfotomaculum sp.]
MVIRSGDSLILRLISAAAGIPLLILAAWWGGWLLILFVGVLYFTGVREMLRLLSGVGLTPRYLLAYVCGLVLVAAAYFRNGEYYPEALICCMLVCVLPLIFLFPRYTPPEAGVTFLSVAYLSLFFCLYLIRLLPNGFYWLLLTLVGTWAFDTLAYFVGRRFGRQRMTPELSPGKTLEGFCAGLAGSSVAAGIFAFYLPFNPLLLSLLGLVLGGVCQVGDLVLSAVKRATGHKDTGFLIPGHGGVLDRFDSMLLSAPAVYVVAGWLS